MGGRGPVTTRPRTIFGLQLDLLGYGKRVVYLDVEIAHRAFQLRVPEQVGFILRISFLIENQRLAAHRSVLARLRRFDPPFWDFRRASD